MRKKKSNKEGERKEKQSRAKYRCPNKLEDLIYQVNLIPPDFQMQSLQFLTERGLTKTDALRDCLKYTPPKFKKHLEFISGFDKVSSETDERTRNFYLQKMADEYFEYFEMRDSMLTLLGRLEIEREHPNDFFDWIGCPLPLRTLVYRDVNGKLQKTGLGTLIGEFDDSRLRRCAICKCVFWAKYKNSFTCSDRCLNALRQRRSRKKNKETINAKRQERYQQRKQEKELERKSRQEALLDKYKNQE
jgi:hypothetical protein